MKYAPCQSSRPLVGVIMGSQSDWETMRHADEMLTEFGVPHEAPRRLGAPHAGVDGRVRDAAAARGLEVIIAGAGGAAHLPGMVAAHTVLPVIGVPVQSAALERARLAAVDRPDAEGRAGGDGRDRHGRRGQRRSAGGRDSGDDAARAAREAAGLPRIEIADAVRRDALP